MLNGPTKYGATNVLRRKARSLFSVAGIAIGISAVISLIAISSGLLTAVRTLLSELPADLLVVAPHAAGLEGSTLPEELVPQIASLRDVESAEPMIMRLQNFPVGRLVKPLPGSRESEASAVFAIFGVQLDGEFVERFEIVEGQGFSDGATDEVMIGSQIARRLKNQFGLEDLPPLLPHGPNRAWEVRGVFRTGGIADTAIVVPYETAQEFTGMREQTSAVLVRVKDAGTGPMFGGPADLTGTISTINGMDPQTAVALEPGEFLDRFGDDLENLQRLVWSIGLIAALAGAVGVLNTMMSNVHERTREIGLLLAVGWTRTHMIGAVLVEGLIISLAGGLLAIPLGIGLVEAASWLMQVDPVPQGIHPQVYVLGLSLSLLLGLLGSLLPAWRASRLSPVEALREI